MDNQRHLKSMSLLGQLTVRRLHQFLNAGPLPFANKEF
ncbi:hypothetical protein OROMI_008044 [Orobanche minor]